jgi:DNA-binding MarR family transcriptional regulator
MDDSSQFTNSLRAWVDEFTHRSMQEWSRYVRSTGFSMPQFFMLMHIHRHQQCGVSDLSGHMEVSPAAASQLADKLVQAGLLERSEDPQDRRARHLALTPKGRQLLETGIAERYRWVDDISERLEPEQRVKVVEAMQILSEAMQAAQSRANSAH